MSAAAAPVDLRPDLALWKREVDALAAKQGELCAAARELVREVLLALAVDPASDRDTRRDVLRLLAALEPELVPPLEAVA